MFRLFSIIALYVFAAWPLHADKGSSKDWAWSTDERDVYYAATVNSADQLLGQFCYLESGNCVYVVSFGTTCDVGHQYAALVNSDSGATSVSLICLHKSQDKYIFIISPFDDIDKVVRQASRIGIAIPIQNDQFKVARFGLAGSTYAIEMMRAAVEAKMQRNPRNSSEPPAEEYL